MKSRMINELGLNMYFAASEFTTHLKKVVLLIVLLISCNKKDHCAIDTAFKKRFDETIKFLIRTETKGESFYQESDKMKAIYFLESVTGIKSQIYWGDIFGYETEELLEEDLEKWQQ